MKDTIKDIVIVLLSVAVVVLASLNGIQHMRAKQKTGSASLNDSEYVKAKVFLEKQERAKTIARYKLAKRIKASADDPAYVKAKAFFEKQKREKVIADYKLAKRINVSKEDLEFLKAKAFFEKKKKEKMIADYKAANWSPKIHIPEPKSKISPYDYSSDLFFKAPPPLK